MFRFSKQDKQDFIQLIMGLALFYGCMSLMAQSMAKALSIADDSARPLLGGIVTVIALLCLLKDIVLPLRRIIIPFCVALLMVAAYPASIELYIKHFTLFGMGELPPEFSWAYASGFVGLTVLTAIEVKRQFFAH